MQRITTICDLCPKEHQEEQESHGGGRVVRGGNDLPPGWASLELSITVDVPSGFPDPISGYLEDAAELAKPEDKEAAAEMFRRHAKRKAELNEQLGPMRGHSGRGVLLICDECIEKRTGDVVFQKLMEDARKFPRGLG